MWNLTISETREDFDKRVCDFIEILGDAFPLLQLGLLKISFKA